MLKKKTAFVTLKRAFDSFSCPGGMEFDHLSLPGGGAFDHHL